MHEISANDKVIHLDHQPYQSTGVIIEIDNGYLDIWLPEFNLLFHQRFIPREYDFKYQLLSDGTLVKIITSTESISQQIITKDIEYPINIYCYTTEIMIHQKIKILFPHCASIYSE